MVFFYTIVSTFWWYINGICFYKFYIFLSHISIFIFYIPLSCTLYVFIFKHKRNTHLLILSRISIFDTFDNNTHGAAAPLFSHSVQIYDLPLPFWYPKNYCVTVASLLHSYLSNSKYPLCYWSIILVCFYSNFYEYFVQKKLIGNQR